MSSQSERRCRLYGPHRSIQVQAKGIENLLKKTNVLQNGEYNYTNEKLKSQIYETSTNADYLGQNIIPTKANPSVFQGDHHFTLGYNTSAKTYQGSTTKDDFNVKNQCRTEICEIDSTINWPHLEPQYQEGTFAKQSEYDNSFTSTKHVISAPVFPRIKVSNLKLPLKQEHFRLKDASHFQFGNDERSNVSEQQRAFGRSADGNLSEILAIRPTEAQNVIRMMKQMDRTSHVFRGGDYNGHVKDYISTSVGDYGPRTMPPEQIVAAELVREALMSANVPLGVTSTVAPVQNTPNELVRYARTVTVPLVYREANQGKGDSISTHFQFGTDDVKVNSMYGKDFEPVAVLKPKFYVPPAAGNIIQNEPSLSKLGTSTHKVDFMSGVKAKRERGDKANFEKTMALCYTDNVIPTANVNAQDRLISLSHGDYREPPPSFKAMQPVKGPYPTVSFLNPNDALPYEGLPELSEAKNNYAGSIRSGCYSFQNQLRREQQEYRGRKHDELDTHFVVGNTTADFLSESRNQYTGQTTSAIRLPPAGITEDKTKVKFDLYNMSENQQDLRAVDPYVPSSKESLHARYTYTRAEAEDPFSTSVMKSDYRQLEKRRLNDDHLKMLQKYETLYRQPIARSHLFHTDNTGQNVFKTTTMDDFTQPETMTGQKLLGAR